MTAERISSTSGQLLNERSRYISELRSAGFQMSEVRPHASPFNAILYQKENSQGSDTRHNHNLFFIPGILTDAGAISHVNTAFLSELEPKVDLVMGCNAAISKTSLETKKYNHNLTHQVRQIVELYERAIPDGKRDQPIVLVGYSMGGATAPLVARKLLERGFAIDKVVLIAPPGLTERSETAMLRDVLKMTSKKRVYADIPVLYPSPADIAGFMNRFEELSNKADLTAQEKEELEKYQLAIRRQTEPDKLTLTNVNQRILSKIQKIDEEMAYLLDPTRTNTQARIDKLQKRRRKMLFKPIRKVIAGKIYNERTQKRAKSRQVVRRVGNSARSLGELRKTGLDMASEITLHSIQELVDYYDDTKPEQPLEIAVVVGSDDPIVGKYKVGDVKKVTTGENVTLTEIGMTNFDHFSLYDDPMRVAQVINRIMEDKTEDQKAPEPAMV